MKRISIFTIVIACGISFMACNKEDQTTLNAPGANSTIVDYNYTSAITYELVTQPSGMMSPFKWNSGYINTKELIFNDAQKMGDAVTNQKFGTPVIQNVPLFFSTVLGIVKMPAVTCDEASFEVDLAPYTPAREGRTGIAFPSHSFFLSGIYNLAVGMPPTPGVPVQVVIDDPVTLNSIWLSNIVINKISYTAIIDLNLDQITNGITPAMMSNATVTDGTVFITSTSNRDMYHIILNNLQGNLIPAQFTTPLVSTVNPPIQ